MPFTIGVNQLEVDEEDHNKFWYSSRIIDQGDLSTYYGYQTLDAKGYTIKAGKVYPEILSSIDDVLKLNATELLRSGYTYIRLEHFPKAMINSPVPFHLIGKDYEVPELHLKVGINPTFLLEKGGEVRYVVVNGFLVDTKTGDSNFKNAMIFR